MGKIKSLQEALKISGNDARVVRAGFNFLQYVNRITDENIKNFTYSALQEASYQFWLAPSSSTGKHHPEEDNGTSGLIRHLIKASEISIQLLRAFDINNYGVSKGDDITLAATLLHDICKNGLPEEWRERTDYRHGLLAYNWLDQFKLGATDKHILKTAVRYHMWRWCQAANEDDTKKIGEKKAAELNKQEVEAALHVNDVGKIVQLSDYLASRETISFMPSINMAEHPKYKEEY